MDLHKCKFYISTRMSLKLVPKGQIKTWPRWVLFFSNIFKGFFMNEKFCISIWFSLKLVSNDQMDSKTALGCVKAWCRTGEKLLPEPVLTQITNAYTRHKGRWVKAMAGHCNYDHILSRVPYGKQDSKIVMRSEIFLTKIYFKCLL